MANLSFYAVCPFGLEELLAGEISACGAERIRAARGGVSFSGSAATAMAVCLNSRLASRVLMKVAEASYWDTRDIYEMAADTPWEKWFGPDLTIKVSANGQRCPLESIDFAVLRIKDGICDRFRDLAGRRPDVERYNPDVRIAAFLTYDTCTFYLDLAGEALFKRGWRLTHGEAPLKENLAAGLLMLSGWDPSQTLIDPFCGSGTIGIEAAQMAAGMAPGLNRRFAFEKLEGFDVDLWAEMKEDASIGTSGSALQAATSRPSSSRRPRKTPAARASATCSTTDALPSVRATPAKPVPKKAWRPDFSSQTRPTVNSPTRSPPPSSR